MKLPSVSKILDATMPAEKRAALEAWKQRVGEVKAENIRQAAMLRGRIIDEQIDTFRLTGVCDDIRISKHLTGYSFLHHELPVTSMTYGFQGRLDAVLGINEQAILTDFKGSTKWKKPKYLEDYELQIGAYALACEEMGIEIHRGCVCLFIPDRATPQLHWIQRANLDKASQDFLLRVEQYNNQHARAIST